MTIVTGDLAGHEVARAYGRWALVYDALCGRIFAPAHRAATAAANRIGGHVLEVGVGTGLLVPLYGPHVRLTGVDLSGAMLAKARARVAALGLRGSVELELADVHDMAHPDASHDAIVLPFVLTLVAEPETALDNCLRMLKPGGEIIIVSHFRSSQPAIAWCERRLAPLVAGIGLRPDFPVARIASWAADRPGVRLLPPEPVGLFGVYTLLRLAKDAPTAQAMTGA